MTTSPQHAAADLYRQLQEQAAMPADEWRAQFSPALPGRRAVSDAERDPAPLLPDDDEPGGSCLVPLVVVIGVPTWMVIGYVLLGMVAR